MKSISLSIFIDKYSVCDYFDGYTSNPTYKKHYQINMVLNIRTYGNGTHGLVKQGW